MQRAAVAADKECRALEQRAQLLKRELAARQDSTRGIGPEALARIVCDAFRGFAFRGTRRDHDPPPAVGSEGRRDSPEVLDRPTAERITGADMQHDHLNATGRPGCLKPMIDVSCSHRIYRHLDRIVRSTRGGDIEPRKQVPLVFDRMPRTQASRPIDTFRIHERPRGNVVSDAPPCAAEHREQRRTRAAVEIDRDVEPLRAKRPAEPQIGNRAAQSAEPWGDDHVVEMWILKDDGCGVRFDDVADAGIREAAAQSANRGRREHDVADLAETDQKNPEQPSSLLHGCFVDQHDGYVIFDRIHTFARFALQCCAVLDEDNGRFARRTRENLEELRIDRHARTI